MHVQRGSGGSLGLWCPRQPRGHQALDLQLQNTGSFEQGGKTEQNVQAVPGQSTTPLLQHLHVSQAQAAQGTQALVQIHLSQSRLQGPLPCWVRTSQSLPAREACAYSLTSPYGTLTSLRPASSCPSAPLGSQCNHSSPCAAQSQLHVPTLHTLYQVPAAFPPCLPGPLASSDWD